MTFMMESSRSLLFTQWGLDAGHDESTDPDVWHRMPDQFSTNPKVKALLQRVKAQKAARKQLDEAYYHDDHIDELLHRPLEGSTVNGVNGHGGVNGDAH